MTKSWQDETFVSFDVETSGQYPLGAEICEVAAVKWSKGKIIDSFQSLAATKRRMSDQVIAIHNITNEMLVGAPPLSEVIKKFYDFIEGAYLIAHHAPFDLGFIAPEFERLRLSFPKRPVFCSSLLARRVFPESENHKLQTLIRFFNLEQGTAHRALDDARACLEVGLKIFNKIGPDKDMAEIASYQNANLLWTNFSISALKGNSNFKAIVEALEQNSPVQIVYSGGSKPGQARTVMPLGIVRNPLDDYLVAREENSTEEKPKRYFLNKITSSSL